MLRRSVLLLPVALAAGMDCDLSRYREQAGLTAANRGGELALAWSGERRTALAMRLGIDGGVPVVRELSSGRMVAGRNLRPEFAVISGRRRSGHGLPEELRWDVYWDAPLNVPGPKDGNTDLPRRPEEIRRASAAYKASSCTVTTDGGRLEVDFPGLDMGIFSGSLRFTVYRGSNLVRMEAVAKTEEPSVAYIYRGGLSGFSTRELERVSWRDVGGNAQQYEFGGTVNRDPVALRARNRLAVAEGPGGSVAVFPPPHQFFFARQLEVNLGFVWYRKDSGETFSLGVRQNESHEGYNQTWVDRVWALYNAPPGTWQRMPVYFHVSPWPAKEARDAVMEYTRGDRYKPLPGFKTMAVHFHTGFAEELMRAGSLDVEAPWIPAIRALGVNIVYNTDFHGDGHPNDPGPLRLKELQAYYEACRRHSDRDFLILPGEEPNAYFGGHYDLVLPKPVFWIMRREPGRQFIEQEAGFGTVYRVSNAAEMLEMLKRENALVYTTHPRTKGSTGFPDKVRETDFFKSDRWLGGGFKALPVDLSEKRLCERRCFGVLDDMNNWGAPKYLLGEVDTYKKFPEYDLYGDFVVNYVALDAVPPATDWTPVVEALRAGRFFVTTGEVLIRNFRVNGRSGVSADVEWTFPLEFVEVVWGDGRNVQRKVVSATALPPFGLHRFEVPVDLTGQKWVRLAAWDSAVNGAFTQPAHLP